MRLRILGSGGAVNNGLPHNAVLLNDQFLVDCPHDLVHSLQTLDVDTGRIDRVYISHFHGDHTFGFPFLVLNKWIGIQTGKPDTGLSVYGPRGIRKYLIKLTEMAWTKDHPCFQWLAATASFTEIKKGSVIAFGGDRLEVFAMEHIRNTFGFTLVGEDGTRRFSYMTDTKWCRPIAAELRKKPKVALVDINGGTSGIHMSYDEVVQNALPITKKSTRYLGTHLSGRRTSEHPLIQVVYQGDEFEV